jgi:putative transposase
MTAHLGYDPHERAGHNSGNSRNGTIAKTVQTGVGPVPRPGRDVRAGAGA